MATEINGISPCNHAKRPETNGILANHNSNHSAIISLSTQTLGHHLAHRLVEIGVSDIFTVPGDSNLTLLDYLVVQPGLNVIGCCNELNAGYAADGYARSRRVGACVVTFTVGGLSILNAIAGAYSEDLPVICIVGGPNSNDYGCRKILHHTIGLPDFNQELACFRAVTCYQAVINSLEDAHHQIDAAIAACLKESKPVYISISCNLVAVPHFTFIQKPIPLFFSSNTSDEVALEAALEATAEILNNAVKPVMVAGPKLFVSKACESFLQLGDACGYAVAVLPSAKGLIPENHPKFIGTYWGCISTAFCAEIVETADASLFVGPVLDDISSLGNSLLFKKDKAIIIEPQRVLIPNGPIFRCVLMKDFLKALAQRLKNNATAYENYKRIYVPEALPNTNTCDSEEALRIIVLFKHIQKMLLGKMAVIAEAGDSWFLCQKLRLPQGCRHENQLLYASTGWSVGATLGYAQAAPDKRVIACIGDGSFQMAAQEVSTMIRCEQKNIIFLINNGGYTTEVEIHDGPYNVIKNWDYTALVDAIQNREGKCWTAKVHCEKELVVAIETTMTDKKDSLCFIEVIVHRDDSNKELLQLGSRLAAANGRI
ncbi:hypothetical protein ACOSQ2_029538 [Xanthoceras sorbifolium]